MNKIKKLLSQLTLEEKAMFITGAGAMNTLPVERLKIKAKEMADGPHGIRSQDPTANCVCFPSMSSNGSSWNKESVYQIGNALAKNCIHRNIQMILAPGINIKRSPYCGRNFEYVSEDPVLAGEIGASFIQGVEDLGVATSLKHFAVNSQENFRTVISSEIDERTLREIYLKGFEIAVKKAKPQSVMCAYNKVNSIWCAENKALLTDILRTEWNYEGFVVSDWGAVHDECRSFCAGLDLQMPKNSNIVDKIKEGLNNGTISMEIIDQAVTRILRFALRPMPKRQKYDRDALHEVTRKVASETIVLLQNKNNLLPLKNGKIHKIAVIGDLAIHPAINGQGSAEVYPLPEYIDSPLEELKKNLPDVQIDYIDCLNAQYPTRMSWPSYRKLFADFKNYDAVLVFVGIDGSKDSEKYDRYDAHFAPYIELLLNEVMNRTPNSVVVMQTGSCIFKSDWSDRAGAILQMGLAGEGGGKAIADVLTGIATPSGKLAETYPTRLRQDMDIIGDGVKVEYTEKWRVGYRYYDLHPEEVWFPFGYGLSYTKFNIENPSITGLNGNYTVSFDITNIGERNGAEVVQIYVGDPISTISKPKKELKAFEKIHLDAKETKHISIELSKNDFAYYNTMLHDWVVEPGRYDVYIATSSKDIAHILPIFIENPNCYTTQKFSSDMIG